MAELGELIPGGGSNGSWSDFVKDPVMRSALVSTGLQLMAGGWGNPMQQLGVALGHGAESAGATAKALQDQGNLEAKMTQVASEGAKDRESREKVAKIGASSRQEVANIRVAGMLERAAMIHGPSNDKEWKIYSDAKNTYFKKEKDNQILTGKSDDQILTEAEAYAKETLRGMRSATGGGAALSDGVSSPNTGIPNGVAPVLGSGKTGAQATPSTKQGLIDLLKGPNAAIIKRHLETPEGRKKILEKRPDLAKEIEWYTGMTEAYGKKAP